MAIEIQQTRVILEGNSSASDFEGQTQSNHTAENGAPVPKSQIAKGQGQESP